MVLGIVLEGGGAKGAFHMGALKALIENGYKIDGIVGTSIGAFNAALVCQGDFQKAYDLWINMEPSTLFNIEDDYMERLVHFEISKEMIKHLSNITRDIIENKGIDISSFMEILDEFICEEKLRKSTIDFGLVTVSISDMKPLELYKEDIPEGMIKDYIMASASFPGFQLKAIDGKYYIDGGVYDNCPVNLLIRKGYKEVMAIRTNRTGKSTKLLKDDVNIISIVPSEDLGMALIFDNELIRKNIDMGYYDTMKVIRHLKGERYYIEPYDEDAFYKFMYDTPKDLILQIGKVLKIPEMDSKRMLFERIIPTLGELLKAPITATYQDIFIGLLETIAELKGINRFKIYTINSLMEQIEQEMPKESVEARKKQHLFDLKKLSNQILGKPILEEIAYAILDAVPVGAFKMEEEQGS